LFSLKAHTELDNFAFRPEFKDYQLPADIFLQSNPSLHAVNAVADFDGKYRRLPVLIPYDGAWIPSLSLSALKTEFGLGPNANLEMSDRQLVYREDKQDLRLPLDDNGLLAIHFYDLNKGPKVIPAAPIFESAKAIRSGEV